MSHRDGTITVKQLIEALAQYPEDAMVICQSDAEGNGYSPLAGVDEGEYRAHNTWSGEIVDEEDEEYDEEDDPTGGPTERVVILFPVN